LRKNATLQPRKQSGLLSGKPLGSARFQRAGWKARPLLHPRYGGILPKRTFVNWAINAWTIADSRGRDPEQFVMVSTQAACAPHFKDLKIGNNFRLDWLSDDFDVCICDNQR